MNASSTRDNERRLISFVVPVYNEQDNVVALCREVAATMRPLADRYDYEMVFTDNHSEDETFERLQELAKADSRVRVFRFSRNFGFQRSILTGYRMARGDAAVQLDADMQDPPAVALEFLKLWEAGYHVVFGIRRHREEGAILTRLRGVFYRLLNRLSDHEIPEQAGDFRLVDRKVIDLLHGYDDEKPYIRGFIAELGFRQVGVVYDRAARERGESKFSFLQLVDLALDGIVSNSIAPLRFASFVGVSCFVTAILGVAFYAVIRLIYGHEEWPAGIATIIILILMSTAVNGILFGLLGEYVARIFLQVKSRPLTIIERRIDTADGNAASAARSMEGPSGHRRNQIVLSEDQPERSASDPST